MDFEYSASSSYALQAGVDGALQTVSGASGVATVSSSFGNHSARMEASCQSCSASDSFQLTGAKLHTEVVPSGFAGLQAIYGILFSLTSVRQRWDKLDTRRCILRDHVFRLHIDAVESIPHSSDPVGDILSEHRQLYIVIGRNSNILLPR